MWYDEFGQGDSCPFCVLLRRTNGNKAGIGESEEIDLTGFLVAQLVESRIVIPVVVGSSPIVHPNKFI